MEVEEDDDVKDLTEEAIPLEKMLPTRGKKANWKIPKIFCSKVWYLFNLAKILQVNYRLLKRTLTEEFLNGCVSLGEYSQEPLNCSRRKDIRTLSEGILKIKDDKTQDEVYYIWFLYIVKQFLVRIQLHKSL
jgi:hypothetical protein